MDRTGNQRPLHTLLSGSRAITVWVQRWGIPILRRSGALAAAALIVTLTAVGQQYTFRFYGSAEGLQNPVVLSLTQDHAGYIWAGTEGGLYRYDGTRFRLMGQADGLPCSTEVHGLFVASDGAVWVNTCASLFRFDGQRFVAIQGLERMLRGAQVMVNATGGGVLIATPTGLYEVQRDPDGSFSMHRYPLAAAYASKPVHGMLRQGSRLWFGCDQQLCVEDAGQVSVFGKEQGLPKESWDGIQISSDGSVWVRSSARLYHRMPGRNTFSPEKPGIASSGFWGAIALRRDGSIMVPTDSGLAIHANEGWTLLNRQRGLRKENAAAVLEGRDGSVWIGLAGGGLARWLGGGVWESWTRDDGLPADIVWGIRRDKKGALWVGTSLGLARIDGSARTRTWTTKDGLGGDNVRWLAETSDGSIWAAMKPGGLARIDPVSGAVRMIGAADGLLCDPEDLYVDRHDRLWAPTSCGLFLNDNASGSNHVMRVETPESFGRAAWKLIEDSHGTIWVTNRSTLWSLREGHWTQHGRAEGLLTDNPYVMTSASDGSIWLRHRYDAGVDRLEISGDRIISATAIVAANPRTAEGTAFHGFDAFGNFWRGSTNGVTILHGDTWTTFTAEDGLISNDCDGEAFWADANGDVWLGTSGGLAHYHSPGPIPPGPLSATPTVARLEINQASRLIRAEFTSLNYKAEQLVRFAYRLDKGPWTDSAERSVSMTGLGAGEHRLEVRCRVRDGPFGPAIAAAEFRMEPTWPETWWARLLSMTLVLSTVVQFMRWRLSAAARKQAELEAVVAGRTANLIRVNRLLDDKAQQLRRSEDRLNNAERLAHVGHWDWDVKTNRLSWSEEMFRIFSVPQDCNPTHEATFQAVLPHDRERVEQWLKDCIAARKGGSIEFQIARPDGDVRILSCRSELSLGEQGLPERLFGACQDVTEARRAQQEASTRQKLESVGTLAAGIAHDFNNLLGGVMAQAELAMAKSAAGAYPEKELTTIMDVAFRGSEIVRQLITYAGKDSGVLGHVDISQVVTEMLELLKVLISKRATLVADIGRDLPAVWANAAQIRQIVLNLVTNASEAISGGHGTVRVTARMVTSEEREYVRLEVSDNGCGMSPEIQARVFDPFFTTKSAGHGLGLAVVHGIVRGFQGTIHLTSKPGQGTMVQVLLPCADARVARTSIPAPDAAKPSGPTEEFTVLLVEDEDPLRNAVATMLRKTGLTVLEAADGTAAVDLLRSNACSIDVILLDITIPGLSSDDVVQAAAARPNIKVILTSAYSQEMFTSSGRRTSYVRGFIRKPYRLRDLVHALRNAASPHTESSENRRAG